jgi:tight adherence protein B
MAMTHLLAAVDTTLLLFAGAVAGLVFLLFWVLRDLGDQARAMWERRLKLNEPKDDPSSTEPTVVKVPRGWGAKMDYAFNRMIQRTGLQLSPEQALAIMILLGVGLAVLLVFWKGQFWLSGLGLTLGMIVPLVVFMIMQARWRRTLQDQLPDALFLLARSLRAGLSLDQAIALLGSQGLKPLADEFHRCAEHIKLGLAAPLALQFMAQRIQLSDFNVLVSLTNLHRATGGNLALLLDRAAAGARERNQFRGYFRSATALGRITAVFIGGAAPVLAIIYLIWQPEYIAKFTQSPGGWMALGLAVALEIIGVTWLYLLLRLEY